jgi:hypothetical protein
MITIGFNHPDKRAYCRSHALIGSSADGFRLRPRHELILAGLDRFLPLPQHIGVPFRGGVFFRVAGQILPKLLHCPVLSIRVSLPRSMTVFMLDGAPSTTLVSCATPPVDLDFSTDSLQVPRLSFQPEPGHHP